jgi:hypothetical protein
MLISLFDTRIKKILALALSDGKVAILQKHIDCEIAIEKRTAWYEIAVDVKENKTDMEQWTIRPIGIYKIIPNEQNGWSLDCYIGQDSYLEEVANLFHDEISKLNLADA